MIFKLYSLILYVLQPLLLIFMLIRSYKAPQYRQRLVERYGFYGDITRPASQGIIVHAASVGEVIAAIPLVKQIQQDYPDLAITFTTITPTGSERAKAAFGNSVNHLYLPFDLPDCVQRFINFVQPKACIVIETEIWPNLIRTLATQQIPFIIANARLSERSTERYGKLKKWLKPMFDQITMIAAQDQISADRYASLNYQGQLAITGNLKYDLNIPVALLEQQKALKQQLGERPVWIAASTHEGEDQQILESHQQLLRTYPDLLLILVPRHPERFDNVAQLIAQQNLAYVRRSQQIIPMAQHQVLLGDTMGELMLMYGVADIAFIGGSLVNIGGHNPLEPLAFKLPIMTGKHIANFAQIFKQLDQVKGVIWIDNSKQLSQQVEQLLNSTELRQQYGNAGHQILVQNKGALAKLMQLIKPYLERN